MPRTQLAYNQSLMIEMNKEGEREENQRKKEEEEKLIKLLGSYKWNLFYRGTVSLFRQCECLFRQFSSYSLLYLSTLFTYKLG